MSFEQFTLDHIKGLEERQDALAQLEKLDSVWIGPDVAIEKSVVVNPGQVIQGIDLIINKKDLPSIDITRGAFKSLSLSVRSFYAQTGIDVLFHGSEVTDAMLKDIENGKDTKIPINVVNYGQRSVEVNGNVMRFFWVNDKQRLRGENLVNTITTGDFVVDGIEGEDWFLRGNEESDTLTTLEGKFNNALSVVVRLKPDRFYIPSATEPIRKDNSVGTRENLSELLQPIPSDTKLDFEIGETPKIKFGPNIIGIINTGVTDEHHKHISSPFVDPGFDRPIRTEILHGANEVEFFLYKKQ